MNKSISQLNEIIKQEKDKETYLTDKLNSSQ